MINAIEFGGRLDIVEGETKVRDVATWLNKQVDVPGVPEAIEQMLLERALDAASAVTQENLPALVDVAQSLAKRFSKPPVSLFVRAA